MTTPLENLATSIEIAIAMAADMNSVGVDENETEYVQWRERLQMAVDNGLEAVERRACGYDS